MVDVSQSVEVIPGGLIVLSLGYFFGDEFKVIFKRNAFFFYDIEAVIPGGVIADVFFDLIFDPQ